VEASGRVPLANGGLFGGVLQRPMDRRTAGERRAHRRQTCRGPRPGPSPRTCRADQPRLQGNVDHRVLHREGPPQRRRARTPTGEGGMADPRRTTTCPRDVSRGEAPPEPGCRRRSPNSAPSRGAARHSPSSSGARHRPRSRPGQRPRQVHGPHEHGRHPEERQAPSPWEHLVTGHGNPHLPEVSSHSEGPGHPRASRSAARRSRARPASTAAPTGRTDSSNRACAEWLYAAVAGSVPRGVAPSPR
jgi:hypothetical protein